MNEKDPGAWASILNELSTHKLAWFTIVSAAGVAMALTIKDGKGWKDGFWESVICVAFGLALAYTLKMTGIHKEWLQWVGVFAACFGSKGIRSFFDNLSEVWKKKGSGGN